MDSAAVKGTKSPGGEKDFPLYFGEWVKQRRVKLSLTQAELSDRASCSVFALRKIEAGERRPSRQLAELLAKSLEVPPENQAIFIKVARGELGVDRLPSPAPTASHASKLSGESGSTAGNLPRTLTPFIGREPELAALGGLLGDPQCALLTIVGPGGIGKTRLAIAAAELSRDLFPDGVWFVPLAPLHSPVQIVPAIASALEFKFQDPTDPQAQLLWYLRAKKALLLLDNAEHLLDEAGSFTEILKACPQLKLLVTSRERLNMQAEWVFEIQGLPVPHSEQAEPFEAYSSVALFLQSARRVQAGFELRESQRRCVLEICRILEGMPLGIELAAAWVGLLPCEEIAKEIERNLDFLSVTLRDLPERHRSLRATLDHSWKLLADEEKLILSRLAVFRGSFSREAAQEICEANLAILSSLRNKSLLYRGEQELYSLHEIIRQYAGLKLAEIPEEKEHAKDRHALYYVRCLAEWERALQSSRQLQTLNEMAPAIDNLSQGWQHMIMSCRPRPGESNQLCADLLHSALFSLSLFYEMRRRSLEAIALFKESVECLQAVQAEFEGTEDQLRFLSILGHITAYLGLHHYYILQPGKAIEYLEAAIQLLEKCQSRVELAQTQVLLGEAENIQGHLQESAVLLEQSREVFREAGEDWWYLLSNVELAATYTSLGKLQETEAILQEGIQLVEPGDYYLGLPLRNHFAFVLNLKKEFARAELMLQENLQLSYQLGSNDHTATILFNLGRVALASQRIEQAIEYIQKAIQLECEAFESPYLAMYRLYLGKCFAARPDRPAARTQFRQVVQDGQALDKFHLVCWGLVGIARTYIEEGQIEKALEIALLIRDCPTEYQRIEEDRVHLLAELQAALPEGQLGAALQQGDGEISPEGARAGVLAYVRKHITE